MPLYRKELVTVEAILWTGSNFEIIKHFLGDAFKGSHFERRLGGVAEITIKTSEDSDLTEVASRGDFIIRGIQGEFYTCKPDMFEATHERV